MKCRKAEPPIPTYMCTPELSRRRSPSEGVIRFLEHKLSHRIFWDQQYRHFGVFPRSSVFYSVFLEKPSSASSHSATKSASWANKSPFLHRLLMHGRAIPVTCAVPLHHSHIGLCSRRSRTFHQLWVWCARPCACRVWLCVLCSGSACVVGGDLGQRAAVGAGREGWGGGGHRVWPAGALHQRVPAAAQHARF